jgi:hypothetical protein
MLRRRHLSPVGGGEGEAAHLHEGSIARIEGGGGIWTQPTGNGWLRLRRRPW